MVTLRNETALACEVTLARNWVFGGKGTDSCLYVLRQISTGSTRVRADGNLFTCPDMAYIGAKFTNGTSSSWPPALAWPRADWDKWQTAQVCDYASALTQTLGIRPEQIMLQMLPPDGRRRDGMTQAPGVVP